jgi:hypothetical protein
MAGGVERIQSLGGERNTDQSRKRLRTDFPHNGGAMIFHRALANLQVRRDVLARAAGKRTVEDLMVAGRQAFNFCPAIFRQVRAHRPPFPNGRAWQGVPYRCPVNYKLLLGPRRLYPALALLF